MHVCVHVCVCAFARVCVCWEQGPASSWGTRGFAVSLTVSLVRPGSDGSGCAGGGAGAGTEAVTGAWWAGTAAGG